MIYADTSFIAKLYWKESDTSKALGILKKHKPPFIWTDFHALELSNAISLRIFRNELSHEQSQLIFDQIEQDLKLNILFYQSADWEIVLKTAKEISQKNTSFLGTRSLDILHLACAASLKNGVFLTFDERQLQLAKKMGFKTC